MKRFTPGLAWRAAGWVVMCNGLVVAEPPVPQEAFYLVQSGREHHEPFVTRLRVAVGEPENVGGLPMVWWEFSAVTRTGLNYGVRALSERAPMTSPLGVGAIQRYLYRDANARVFEYRDTATGRAAVPKVSFREEFLPNPAADARYDGGFASAGDYLGHSLVRVIHPASPADRVGFENPVLLDLRSDLLIGAQVSVWTDYSAWKPGEDIPQSRPYTIEDMEALISAGVNLFGDVGEKMDWLIGQPVYFLRAPSFPDTYYRSNYYPGALYMDEPSIRFGWDSQVPGRHLLGPEQHAGAVRQRVKAFGNSQDLRLPVGADPGALELHASHPNSWDTHQYSAWHQLAAGAPALVHEGRYRDRGFGWHPESSFGDEGLEGLGFDDMMDYYFAFLRGASRAWDGNWGTSFYPEGQRDLDIPAARKAYDMGARYVLFWVFPYVDHNRMLEVASGLMEHVRENPRGDIREVNRRAHTAIVLPPGYAITPDGSIWGAERNQVSRGGATYGEIAAAAVWEGILCTRAGVSYDFQVDAPFIRDLGYKRLVYVREDGSLDPSPAWERDRPAIGLEVSLEPSEAEPVVARASMDAEYGIPRARGIAIDGSLDDWAGVEWIPMGRDSAAGDPIELEVTVPNIASAALHEQYRQTYLGIEFAQMTCELREEFGMQDYHIIGPEVVDESRPGISLEQGAVIITEVRPGSPAEEYGLRPGDIIRAINGRRTQWHFIVWGMMHDGGRLGRPESFTFAITRIERTRSGYPGDLGAEVALAVDDGHLYLAASVLDDVHSQPFDGWYYWMGDCLQIGLSPTLSGTLADYSEQDHELGFALRDDGRAVAWRYHGRRGMHRREIPSVNLAIVRDGNRTFYEAAIPLSEVHPLSPDLWPKIGINFVLNDHDGGGENQRKGRLELREGAMTRSKRTADFPVFAFDPSPNREKVSSALVWRRRATPEGGFFRLHLAAGSPESRTARVQAILQSLDSPHASPALGRIRIPLSPGPEEWILRLETKSPPGRYSLLVQVEDEDGNVSAMDRLPVYVYPAVPGKPGR